MRKISIVFIGLLLLCVPAFSNTFHNPVTVIPPATIWAATGDQDNSTDTSIKAASSGVQHCVTSVQVVAIDSIAADETFRILSADTVLWQWVINTTTTSAIAVTFPTPICTVAGEALEVDTAGDPADNLIFYNLQGYSIP